MLRFNQPHFKRRLTHFQYENRTIIMEAMERELGHPLLLVDPHCCQSAICNPSRPCTWNGERCLCFPTCVHPRQKKFAYGGVSRVEEESFFEDLRRLRRPVFQEHMQRRCARNSVSTQTAADSRGIGVQVDASSMAAPVSKPPSKANQRRMRNRKIARAMQRAATDQHDMDAADTAGTSGTIATTPAASFIADAEPPHKRQRTATHAPTRRRNNTNMPLDINMMAPPQRRIASPTRVLRDLQR